MPGVVTSFYYIVLCRSNCTDWAFICTKTTIYTCVSINIILSIAFRNCFCWAYWFARTAFCTITRNYISHYFSPNLLLLLEATQEPPLKNIKNLSFYIRQINIKDHIIFLHPIFLQGAPAGRFLLFFSVSLQYHKKPCEVLPFFLLNHILHKQHEGHHRVVAQRFPH